MQALLCWLNFKPNVSKAIGKSFFSLSTWVGGGGGGTAGKTNKKDTKKKVFVRGLLQLSVIRLKT